MLGTFFVYTLALCIQGAALELSPTERGDSSCAAPVILLINSQEKIIFAEISGKKFQTFHYSMVCKLIIGTGSKQIFQ